MPPTAVMPESLSYRERLQPDEHLPSVLEVDFAAHVEAGRTTLAVDAESTFVVHDGWTVDDAVIQKFKEAREAGIENIVIVTNKRPKTQTDLIQLTWWGEQIGADLVLVPHTHEQRKPSPHMLLQVMQHYEVEHDEMLMIGDKVTGDVAAANAAGVYSIWVDRYGQEDLAGDRWLRRPYEQVIGRFVLDEAANDPASEPFKQHGPTTEKVRQPKLAMIREIEVPPAVAERGLISGYGGPIIELDPDHLAMLPPTRAERLGPVAEAADNTLHSKMVEEWLGEHGGLMADLTTYARVPLGALAMIAVATGHKKAAFSFYVAGQATDGLDGWFSRQSNEDPSSEHRQMMGEREAFIDKVFAFLVGAGLVKAGTKPFSALVMQTGREVWREDQRKKYKAMGYDVRATASSKASTGYLGVVDALSILAKPSARLNLAQHSATAAKVASSIQSPRVWRYNNQRKRRGEMTLAILNKKN